MMKKLYKI